VPRAVALSVVHAQGHGLHHAERSFESIFDLHDDLDWNTSNPLGEFAAVEGSDLVTHCDTIAFKAPHSGG